MRHARLRNEFEREDGAGDPDERSHSLLQPRTACADHADERATRGRRFRACDREQSGFAFAEASAGDGEVPRGNDNIGSADLPVPDP